MTDTTSTASAFVRLQGVIAITGLPKSSVYDLCRKNLFPSPYRLGPKTAAWKRSELDEWIASRQPTYRH